VMAATDDITTGGKPLDNHISRRPGRRVVTVR